MTLDFLLQVNGKGRECFGCLPAFCLPREVRDSIQSPEAACRALRRIRERNRLSQAEIAALLGVSAAAVRAWESGRRKPNGSVRTLIRWAAALLRPSADTCGDAPNGGESSMTSDASDSGNSPEGLGSTPDEPGCQPDGKDAAETVSPDGVTFQENSVADYAAVLAEQIERLRRVAADVDRHYGKKTKRLSFKHRLGYLTARERISSKILDLTKELSRMRSADPPTEAPERKLGGALSWNPDDDGPAALSPAAQ